MREISSGGVVVFGNTILLLRKFNGDWVLPKGRIEEGESTETAALREVFEESGVKGEIIKYLGNINYKYKNIIKDKMVTKTVHWYLMKANNMDSKPQKQEGFADAVFVPMDKVPGLVKYSDEREILTKSITHIKELKNDLLIGYEK